MSDYKRVPKPNIIHLIQVKRTNFQKCLSTTAPPLNSVCNDSVIGARRWFRTSGLGVSSAEKLRFFDFLPLLPKRPFTSAVSALPKTLTAPVVAPPLCFFFGVPKFGGVVDVGCSLYSRNPLSREVSLMPMKKCVFRL
jgi:hypothetical protein